MTIKAGRQFLLEVGDGASPEVFTLIAGLTENSLTINNEAVDVTTKDDAGWRALLDDANIRSVSLSADGRPSDVAVTQTILTKSYDGKASTNYRLIYNSNGITADTLTCNFQVTSYERSGADNDGETFSISLESSGQPVFATDVTL